VVVCCINGVTALTGFCYKQMCVHFAIGQNKEVTVREGSTVVKVYMIIGIIKGVGKKIPVKLTSHSIER